MTVCSLCQPQLPNVFLYFVEKNLDTHKELEMAKLF